MSEYLSKFVKKETTSRSVLLFILSSVFFLISIAILSYLNFYITGFNELNLKLNKHCIKLNNGFKYFNSELNLMISDKKDIDFVKNSYTYNQLSNYINEFDRSSKAYPKLNKELIYFKDSINQYIKTIQAYISDDDKIWADIKKNNLNRINKALNTINSNIKNIINNSRSKFFNFYLFFYISLFVFFLVSFISLFMYFFKTKFLVNFINKISNLFVKLRNKNLSIEDLHNELNLEKYGELNDFSDKLFSFTADLMYSEGSLNQELEKNQKERSVYKLFNKFSVSVLNSINIPILVLSSNDKTIFANSYFCKTCNCRLNDIISKNLIEIKKEYECFNKLINDYKIIQNKFVFQKDYLGEIFAYIKTDDLIDLNKNNVKLIFNTLENVFENFDKFKNVKNDFINYKISKVKSYSVKEISSLLNSSFNFDNVICNKLEEINLYCNLEYLSFLSKLIFKNVFTNVKLIFKSEGSFIDLIMVSSKTKIDKSSFINFIISDFEVSNNVKIEYYENEKSSSIRYRFMED